MFKHLLGVCMGFALVSVAMPASAQSCAARDSVVERLKDRFSEELTVGGLQATRGSQSIMEIWASAETGTYTVLLTNPNGISCVVAAGTDFFTATPDPEPKGTAS